MRSKRFLLLGGIVVLLIALAIVVWRKNTRHWVLALPQFESAKERVTLEQQALQGSPEAADIIVGKLGLFPSSDAFYWANIAAENASRNGAYNMSSFMSGPRPGMNGVEVYGDFQRDRHYFWMQRAAKNKDKDLSEIDKEYLKKEFPNPKEMQPPPETIVTSWKVSEKSLPKIKRAAMLGSPEAAFKIYEHYHSLGSAADEEKFWAIIAAQNGHPKAPSVLGNLMLNSTNSNERIRAQFWLRKPAATGNQVPGGLPLK